MASTADRGRFWLSHAWLPAAVFVGLAVLFERSTLDLDLADHFYDPATRSWIWGDTWWANQLIHTAGKYLIVLIGLVALGSWIGSFLTRRCRPLRRAGAFVTLSIVLGTGLVALLKKTTNVDCPWDMDLYGGDVPFVRVFEDKPDDLARGRCFPGGHSSGAFSLFSFYFLLRDRSRVLACVGWTGVLVLGVIFSFGQWVRGAHFASHDIWSAFLCWFVVLGLYSLGFRQRLWESGS